MKSWITWNELSSSISYAVSVLVVYEELAELDPISIFCSTLRYSSLSITVFFPGFVFYRDSRSDFGFFSRGFPLGVISLPIRVIRSGVWSDSDF